MASFTSSPSSDAASTSSTILRSLENTEHLSINDIESLLIATLGVIEGTDTDDCNYDSIKELWSKHCVLSDKNSNISNSGDWYNNAYKYWESEANCPLDDDGVLGGYGKLTPLDTRDSLKLFDILKSKYNDIKFDKAADCGAGIGRVTKSLLLQLYEHVELVEQSPRLLQAAPAYIGIDNNNRISLNNVGLQNFNPEHNSYDCIWIQWVIGHLHDLDFIQFFRRCSKGLRPGGMIILKDNCAENWTFVVDKQDSSVARCKEYVRLLLHLAGLNILEELKQNDFPTELYPVIMFAMRP